MASQQAIEAPDLSTLLPINNFNTQKLEPLLHEIVDVLLGRTQLASQSDSQLTKAVNNYFSRVTAGNLDKSQIKAELVSGGVSESAASVLSGVAIARRPEIQLALRDRTCSSFFPQLLKDFDWACRVVLCSDRLSHLGEPLVLLTLSLQQLDGSISEVHIELNKTEMDRLLDSCGKINNVLQTLRT